MLSRRRLRRTGRLGIAAGALLVTASLFAVPAPVAAAPATPAVLACPVSAIDPCFDASALGSAGPFGDGGLTVGTGTQRRSTIVPALAPPIPGAPDQTAEPPDAGSQDAGPLGVAQVAVPPIGPPYLTDGHCFFDDQEINCTDPLLGNFNPEDNCFYKALNPPPPKKDPLWGGQSNTPPAALYNVNCRVNTLKGIATVAAGITYQATPPLGSAPLPYTGPAKLLLYKALVLKIVANVALIPVPEQTAPDDGAGDSGLVGLPVWMWSPPGSILNRLLWRVNGISLDIGTAGATIALFGRSVIWTMGNGDRVKCMGLSTAYPTADPSVHTSPDCGYVYTTPGQYPIMASMFWFATFDIPLLGTGTVVIVRTSRASILTINELQVVTQ